VLKLQKEYGVTFDFRLPDTHALYWASLGMEKGLDTGEYVDVHKLNTNRIEFFCLQKMFHRGRLAMSRNAHMGEPPLFSPDLRMIPILFDAYVRDSKVYLETETEKQPVSTNFESGFEGFTRSAILRYYEAGNKKAARQMFEYMRDNFPDPMYERGLDGFVTAQFGIDRALGDHRTTMARLRILISHALSRYEYDEDELAVQSLNRARQIYDLYQSQIVSDRLKIPFSFAEIVENTVNEVDWSRQPRGAYEHVCAKLGITPIEAESKPEDETRP
jgi:hypothetical protein